MSEHAIEENHGTLLIDKPKGKSSFYLVARLRRLLSVKKIGHAGTLDPFATGVMVLLVGKTFTRMSDQLLCADKEYQTEIFLGVTTDSYDCEGVVVQESSHVPSLEEIKTCLEYFQGEVEQVPPMFSAKKINGKKLYELARAGKVVDRKSVKVTLDCQLISYEYPLIHLNVKCSKGTYIRSIGHDLGVMLGCGAHLKNLRRLRSGIFKIENCFDGELLKGLDAEIDLEHLKKHLIKTF